MGHRSVVCGIERIWAFLPNRVENDVLVPPGQLQKDGREEDIHLYILALS